VVSISISTALVWLPSMNTMRLSSSRSRWSISSQFLPFAWSSGMFRVCPKPWNQLEISHSNEVYLMLWNRFQQVLCDEIPSCSRLASTVGNPFSIQRKTVERFTCSLSATWETSNTSVPGISKVAIKTSFFCICQGTINTHLEDAYLLFPDRCTLLGLPGNLYNPSNCFCISPRTLV